MVHKKRLAPEILKRQVLRLQNYLHTTKRNYITDIDFDLTLITFPLLEDEIARLKSQNMDLRTKLEQVPNKLVVC